MVEISGNIKNVEVDEVMNEKWASESASSH